MLSCLLIPHGIELIIGFAGDLCCIFGYLALSDSRLLAGHDGRRILERCAYGGGRWSSEERMGREAVLSQIGGSVSEV